MSNETRKDLNLLISFVVTLAIGANAFFVKRLVDQMDDTRKIAEATSVEVRILRIQLDESRTNCSVQLKSCRQKQGGHE